MSDETYVDVPAAERAAKELAGKVDEFGTAVDNLKAALQRDHGCWSDDKIGKGFEQSYLGTAEQTQTALSETAKALKNLAGEGIPSVVHQMQDLDAQAGDVVRSYDQELESFDPRSSR